MKIGFFDSGLGGLTILKAVVKALPQYDYEYYGDTKNLPYGDKSEAEIYELVKAGMEDLFTKDCQLIILACNTASAETLRKLQDTFLLERYPDRRILGVIIPTVEEIMASKKQRIVLIATKRTIESRKYEQELSKAGITPPELIGVATVGLVPHLEVGELEAAVALATTAIDAYRAGSPSIDGIVLGCTHYTLIKEALRTYYGDEVTVFSQDEIIPLKLARYLENHPEIVSTLTSTGTRNIHLTAHTPHYDAFLAEILEGKFLAD